MKKSQEIIHPYVEADINEIDLKIINESYNNFAHEKIAPVTSIEKNKYILELFYGPTFAFKDYALQFLGSLFSYALPKASKKLTVLGATSGDTGSAAIHAFRGKKDINVFILHPHNRVSEVQRRQMTSVWMKIFLTLQSRALSMIAKKLLKNYLLMKNCSNKL